MCDYYVRELAQRVVALKEKGRTLQKLRNSDEDEARLQKLDEEQEVQCSGRTTGIRSGSSTIGNAAFPVAL